MKRFVFMAIALLVCFVSRAEDTFRAEDFSLQIENTYLEQLLAQQNFVISQSVDHDFLIAAFMSDNMKKFKSVDMYDIKNRLLTLSTQELMMINGMNFKDPTVSLLLSVFFGSLGVDRFYIGDVGAGVGKLLTGGGLGIWWLIDLFVISNKTKKNNSKDFNEAVVLM